MSHKGIPNHSHKPKRYATDTGWQQHAACRGADPEMFFDANRTAEALALCRRCPLIAKAPCRALGRRERDGVWGGMVHQPRKEANA